MAAANIFAGDLRHEREAGRFDACLDRVLALCRVGDAARPAPDDDTGIVIKIKVLWEVFALQPDTVDGGIVQPALVKEGVVFVVAGLWLWTQLQQEESAHGSGYRGARGRCNGASGAADLGKGGGLVL